MPRLCANLKWLFTEAPFLDRFEAAAKAGFVAVEFASPYEFAPGELRARLRANGLAQVLINTPAGDPKQGAGSGFACLPGQQKAFRDSLSKALDYAAALDCGLVHVMAGIAPAGVAHDTLASVYAANLAWAVDQLGGAPIRLVLESINQRDQPGFFLRTQEQGAAVIEAIGRDKLGLQFDIYHCQVAQGDVTKRIESLLPVIAHMQIADAPGRNEPGTGEISWDYVFERIDASGYAGWVGCEYKPATTTVAGLGWRKRYGLEAGDGGR